MISFHQSQTTPICSENIKVGGIVRLSIDDALWQFASTVDAKIINIDQNHHSVTVQFITEPTAKQMNNMPKRFSQQENEDHIYNIPTCCIWAYKNN